jgi:hypothetical protein
MWRARHRGSHPIFYPTHISRALWLSALAFAARVPCVGTPSVAPTHTRDDAAPQCINTCQHVCVFGCDSVAPPVMKACGGMWRCSLRSIPSVSNSNTHIFLYIQCTPNQPEFSCSRSRFFISDTEFYCSMLLQQNPAPAPFTLQSLHTPELGARWRRRAILLPMGACRRFGRR